MAAQVEALLPPSMILMEFLHLLRQQMGALSCSLVSGEPVDPEEPIHTLSYSLRFTEEDRQKSIDEFSLLLRRTAKNMARDLRAMAYEDRALRAYHQQRPPLVVALSLPGAEWAQTIEDSNSGIALLAISRDDGADVFARVSVHETEGSIRGEWLREMEAYSRGEAA